MFKSVFLDWSTLLYFCTNHVCISGLIFLSVFLNWYVCLYFLTFISGLGCSSNSLYFVGYAGLAFGRSVMMIHYSLSLPVFQSAPADGNHDWNTAESTNFGLKSAYYPFSIDWIWTLLRLASRWADAPPWPPLKTRKTVKTGITLKTMILCLAVRNKRNFVEVQR